MSIQAVSAAIKLQGYTATEKLLLICIANYADDSGRAWPSNKRLSNDSALSERTIRTALKTLCDKGAITRTEREREDGSRGTDIIALQFVDTQIAPPGAKSARGGAMVAGGGAAIAPLTTFEPSLNHQEPSPDDAKAIWQAQNPASRKASSADVLKALQAAVKRGHDPALIVASCQAYYAHPGQQKDAGRWAVSPCKLLDDDRWKDFTPPPPKPIPPEVMEDRKQHYRDTGEWRQAWGPMPKEIAA